MINRNNYEEYFLLLADNELPAEEAVLVKQFAAQHPDLAEELDILMSCRLEEASMPLFPKEKLLRPTQWNAENPEPVQTQMLLLLDEELAPADKQQLEKQIAASATLQTEWNTLQQAKLTAETISHPHKESLQRNDRKVRPLLWIRWAAVAAAVTGLGWLLWTQQEPQNIAPSHTIASTTKPEKTISTIPQAPANTEPQTDPVNSKENQRSQGVTQQAASTRPASNNRSPATRPEETVAHLAVNDNSQMMANAPAENNTTETELVTTRLSSTDASLTAGNAHTIPTPQIAQLSPQKINLPLLASSQKIESFTGSKSDLIAEENDYVTIGGAHVNKQKMRGLFRNVTRTVARSFTKSKIEPDVYATR